jgi:molybdopterin converting factor small subunit
MIEVHLYGKLREVAETSDVRSESIVRLSYQEGDTIEDVITRLGLTPEELSHLFLNHQYSALNRPVHDGDRLGLFPRNMSLLYRQYFPKIEE